MLSLSSIVRQNSGGVAAATSSAPVVVSLAGADVTAAGNTLLVFLAGGNGQWFGSTPPSGWAKIVSGGGATGGTLGVFLRGPSQGLAAGESSWNFTPANATAGPVRWTVFEIEGIASHATLTGNVVDANSGASVSVATSGTTVTATTGVSSTYDGLALSAHVSYNTSGTDSWGSHTGGFAEVVEGSQAGSGSDAVDVSVSGLPTQVVGTFGSTATCSRTLTDDPGAGYSYSFVLTAEGARRAANLQLVDGAEQGTITGNTTGPTNFKVLETATAGVSVSSSAARSGSYGWLLSATSAACNFTQFNATSWAGIGATVVLRQHFRFPTLPSADVEIRAWTTLSGTSIVLRYINSSQKLGLKVGAGTEQVSDTTLTANQWFGVDLRLDTSTSTYTADWQIDYNAELTDTTGAVAQTQATGSGSAGSTISTNRVGWTTSTTATMHVDDFAASGEAAHYPIRDLRVLPLKVDSVGTPSVSGSTSNFGVMTNNGTVNAWNATNARNAVDDVPPDLSGTRDAAVCTTSHASDFAEFPMETYDMAANQIWVRGVRWVACLWANAATAATIRTRVYDGTSEVSGAGYGEADPNADDSATPAWISGMVRPTTGRIDWTQAKVDALTFRVGSNDATPDIGIDCVVFELAVVKAVSEPLFGSSGDSVYVEAARDPDTNGLVGFTVTTVGAGATVNYEVNSVAQTPVVVAANSTQYQAIGGVDFPNVNKLELTPG